MIEFPKRYNANWDGIVLSLDGRKSTDYLKQKNARRCPAIAFWLGAAQQQCHSHGRTFSSRGTLTGRWFDFLFERHPEIRNLWEITPAVWTDFQNWIRATGKTGEYQKLIYQTVKTALEFLHQNRPSLLDPKLQLGRWSQRMTASEVPERDDQIWSAAQLSQINSACRSEITRTLVLAKKVDSIVASGTGRTLKGNYPSDWSDKCAILAWITRSLIEMGQSRVRRTLVTRPELVRHLGFSSADDLLVGIAPGALEATIFAVQFLVMTGANVESIMKLPISCQDENANPSIVDPDDSIREALSGNEHDENEIPLWWEKRRGAGIQVVYSDPNKRFSPAWTVRSYERYSSRLRVAATGARLAYCEEVFLFWCKTRNSGRAISSLSVTTSVSHVHARKFFRSINVPCMPLKMFRHSIHNALVAETGDLKGTARFEGHTLRTAVRRYSRGPARRAAELKLGKLIVSLQNFARGVVAPPPAGLVDAAERQTGFGAIARLWVSAFQNPRLIIHGDAERCARLLQMRNHLLAYRKDVGSARWDSVYEALYVMIENQILPKFSPGIKARAETLVPILPKLCPIT